MPSNVRTGATYADAFHGTRQPRRSNAKQKTCKISNRHNADNQSTRKHPERVLHVEGSKDTLPKTSLHRNSSFTTLAVDRDPNTVYPQRGEAIGQSKIPMQNVSRQPGEAAKGYSHRPTNSVSKCPGQKENQCTVLSLSQIVSFQKLKIACRH